VNFTWGHRPPKLSTLKTATVFFRDLILVIVKLLKPDIKFQLSN